MKRSNQGFTLIELIIVIVILGILAVTASPKFLDLQGDARGATVEGVEASLKGAVNIAYSKALIQGVTGTNDTPANTTNPTISMVYGYPEALATIESVLLDVEDAEWQTFANSAGTIVRIFPAGVEVGTDGFTGTNPAPAACYVEYTEATSSTEATVTSTITDC